MYGLNALYSTFKEKKYFHYECKERINGTLITTNNCNNLEVMLGYVFLTGFVSYSVFSLPMGILFDRYGHQMIQVVSCITFLVGCVLYALSVNMRNWLLFPGTMLLSIASQGMLLCNLPLAGLIPRYRSALISLMSGSFDSSTGLLTMVYLTYTLYGVSLITSFMTIGASGSLVMLLPIMVYLGPMDRIKKHQLSVIINENADFINRQCIKEQTINESLKHYINTRYPTFFSSISSRYFIMQILYEMNLVFRFSFFLSEMSLLVTNTFEDKSEASNLLVTSNYFMVAGGVLAPVGGLIADQFRYFVERSPPTDVAIYYISLLSTFGVPLLISASMNLMYSIMILFPAKWAYYMAFVGVTITRAFLFSLDAAFILQAFPHKFFGMIYGTAMLISGSFSFIQYALLFDDFTKLTTVNHVLIGLAGWSFVHPTILLMRI